MILGKVVSVPAGSSFRWAQEILDEVTGQPTDGLYYFTEMNMGGGGGGGPGEMSPATTTNLQALDWSLSTSYHSESGSFQSWTSQFGQETTSQWVGDYVSLNYSSFETSLTYNVVVDLLKGHYTGGYVTGDGYQYNWGQSTSDDYRVTYTFIADPSGQWSYQSQTEQQTLDAGDYFDYSARGGFEFNTSHSEHNVQSTTQTLTLDAQNGPSAAVIQSAIHDTFYFSQQSQNGSLVTQSTDSTHESVQQAVWANVFEQGHWQSAEHDMYHSDVVHSGDATTVHVVSAHVAQSSTTTVIQNHAHI